MCSCTLIALIALLRSYSRDIVFGVWVRRRIFWRSSRGRERKDVGSWVLLTGFVDASGVGLVTTACSIESPIFVELCRGSVIKRVFKWNDGFSLRLDVRDTR